MKFLFFIFCWLSIAVNADPCGVLTKPNSDAKVLAPIISDNINLELSLKLKPGDIEILGLWKSNSWYLIEVRPKDLEVAYLFYKNPLDSRKYISLWSGAVSVDEKDIIKKWVSDNLKGIPEDLSECFAWYVTTSHI